MVWKLLFNPPVMDQWFSREITIPATNPTKDWQKIDDISEEIPAVTPKLGLKSKRFYTVMGVSNSFYIPWKGCFLCVLRRKLGVFDGGIWRESSTGEKKRRDIWEENGGFVLKTYYFVQIFYFSAAKTTKIQRPWKISSRKLDLLQFSVCHTTR